MKNIYLFGSIILIVELIMNTSCVLASGQAQWGEITYPLPGNLCSQEGTIIVHFRIEGDLDAEPGPWFFPKDRYFRLIVARLLPNEKNWMVLHWFRGKQGRGRMQATLGGLPGQPRPMPDRAGVSAKWKKYEPHWVGFTWARNGELTLWLDGQIVRQQGVGSPELGLGAVTRQGSLVLGARCSPITIYAVHVLDRVRSNKELQVPLQQVDSLFERTNGTLLLDRFEGEKFEPDGKKQTHARVISGFSDECGGIPTQACHFVQTKYGRGLRVYTPPEGIDVPK